MNDKTNGSDIDELSGGTSKACLMLDASVIENDSLFNDKEFCRKLLDFVNLDDYINSSPDLMDAAKSGFDAHSHFINYGIREIFSGTRKLAATCKYLGEEKYLQQNSWIKNLIKTGQISCGLEYYIKYDQELNAQKTYELFRSEVSDLFITFIYFGRDFSDSIINNYIPYDKFKIIKMQDIKANAGLVSSLDLKGWVVIIGEGVDLNLSALLSLIKFNNDLSMKIFIGGIKLTNGIEWFPKFVSPNEISAALLWPAIILSPSIIPMLTDALSIGLNLFKGSDQSEITTLLKLLVQSGARITCFNAKALTTFKSWVKEVAFYKKEIFIEENFISPLPSVSIIIPFKDQVKLLHNCLESILKRTVYDNFDVILVNNGSQEAETISYIKALRSTHDKISVLNYPGEFNFSAINNYAVNQSKSEFVVLLNNDTEIVSPTWLKKLVWHASQDNVGCVGALLMYENSEIQHAGVAIGMNGLVGHAFNGLTLDDLYYNWKLKVPHQVSAVTAACLAVKKSTYLLVNGMDSINLSVALNDVDFCLRIAERGFFNLIVPDIRIMHYESQSREWDCYDKSGRFAKEVEYFRCRHKMVLQGGEKFLDLDNANAMREFNGDIHGLSILILAIRLKMGYGVDLVVFNQASRLLRKGAKVIVGVHDFDGYYYGDASFKVVELKNLGLESLTHDIDEIINAESVDVVIAHTSPFFEALPLISGRPKKIVYEHGDPSPELFKDDRVERDQLKLRKRKNVYPVVDKVIAISKFISDDIGWPAAEILYNGIDHIKICNSDVDLKLFREKYGILDREKKVFLCVSRIGGGESNYKGLEDYVKFKSEYNQDDAYFVIVGRGEQRDANWLREVGIIVILNAAKNDLEAAYSTCDVLLSFSKWEGFNLPVVEAQSLGKLAVALDVGSHREVTRYVFKSVSQIANFLRPLSKKDILNLSSEAVSYVRNYTWDRNGRELAKSIAKTCGRLSIKNAYIKNRTSICIVTKNKPEFIIPCINSLLPLLEAHDVEIIIGDTGSDDPAIFEYYNSISSFVRIFFYNYYNFSKINNYLSAQASGDVIVFLNNDTVAHQQNWLTEVRNVLQGKSVGVVGPMLLFADGSIQHAGVEIFLDEPYRYIGWHPYSRVSSVGLVPVQGRYCVPAVTGACLAVKSDLFNQVNGFNEIYLEECQDVDLCMKIRTLGYQIIYTGDVSLFHFENGTRTMSESNVDRETFRRIWSTTIDNLYLLNPKQRIRYIKLVKIIWKKESFDGVSHYVGSFQGCDITIVIKDGSINQYMSIVGCVSGVRVLYLSQPDNYRYDEVVVVS
jgi:GT2 family glycosyltransferase